MSYFVFVFVLLFIRCMLKHSFCVMSSHDELACPAFVKHEALIKLA